MTGQEIIKKNPAAERGANVVGCNWVLKIVNGKYTSVFEENDFFGGLISLILINHCCFNFINDVVKSYL